MKGKQIRAQYMQDRNLLTAIDNTLTMLEQADTTTLNTIRTAIGWKSYMRDMGTRSIPIGVLIATVKKICKIEDEERVYKCMYKGKFEGMYNIKVLRCGLRNMGYVVTHK